MQLTLNVKLIDRDKLTHKHGVWEFSNQSRVSQVIQNVVKAWQIDVLHVELYYKEERITDLSITLQALKVANKDEIFVKHGNLDIWYEYVECWKRVKITAETKAEKTNYAHMGLQISKVLQNNGFFLTYVNFSKQWCDILGELMRFVDRTQEALRKSACSFFKKLFPNCEVTFLEKKSGTRAGIIVKVINGNDVKIYFMKTYHNAGSGTAVHATSKRHLPDLREMAAYRVLNHIGVGPEVFFPYYEGSTYIYYICTEEIPGFQEVDKIEDDLNLQKTVVVEAYLLSLILGLRDLNDENFGISNCKALAVIDFYVPDSENFLKTNIMNEFKNRNNFGTLSKSYEILAETRSEERIDVAKKALLRWKEIKQISSEIIGKEKIELRNHCIKFGSNPVDVDKYLNDILSNYESICSIFF